MKVFYLEEKLATLSTEVQESRRGVDIGVNIQAQENGSKNDNNNDNVNEYFAPPFPPPSVGGVDIESMRTQLMTAKLEVEEKTFEVETRDALLLKARKAIENLRYDNSNLRKSHDEKTNINDTVSKEVHKLKEEVRAGEGRSKARRAE